MAFSNLRIYPSGEENYETILFYWLDAEINTSDHNKTLQKHIRSIINHLEIFDNQSACQQAIQSLSKQHRLILIVSGRLGRQIVPQIHHLQQVISIYVYCSDKALNEEWAKNFKKIRVVIVDLDILINLIGRIHIQEPISYNIYSLNENQEQATTVLNKNFIDSLVLINALIRLEPDVRDKRELISLFKKQYKGDKNQLHMINEFNDKYMPDTALWWYTRDSFFYKILNKTLCQAQNNFDLLLLFRSYLNNIYQQLKQNQYESAIRVYFSQIMRQDEINYLENPRTQYLSMNSFLWTNINRDIVLDSIHKSDIKNGQKQVLFIIDADPTIGITKPFADISKISYFIDTGEVLFMIGSIFRINKVKEDGQILTLEMKLCGNNEHDLEHIHQSIRKIHEDQNNDNQIDFRIFGDILYRIGKYDCAEKIYHHLLAEHSLNDSSLSEVHGSLGAIAKEKHQYDSSLESYQKSLDIKKRENPSNFIMIGRLYACIGDIYRLKKKDNQALKSFKKAIELYQKNHAENHPYMADFHHNIASIYRQLEEYDEALKSYHEALRLGYQYSSSNYLNIAKSHNGLGNIYYLRNQYDRALEHHQLSLKIKLDAFSPDQHSIAKSYRNIGGVYKMKNNLNEALIYYQKALAIYRLILPSQHQDVIETENEIENLLNRKR